MMTATRNGYWMLAAGLAALYSFAWWMVAHGVMARAPLPLGTAATVDLTLTAGLATWALGSRRGYFPRRAPFVVAALGFVAARVILPANARGGLVVLRLAWAAAELVLVLIVFRNARRIQQRLRARAAGVPFVDALEEALAPTLGVLPSRLLATEIDVLGHALGAWRRKAPPEDARTFSMHRRSHYGLIVGVLIFLIAGESAVLHLVVARLSHVGAWLATVSSVWLALWLVGDAHALRLHPLRLTTEGLMVRVGIRWRTFVPYDAIKTVALADGAARGPTTLRASVTAAADVRLTLDRTLQARGLLGKTRSFDTLLLSADRPDELVAALRAAAPAVASPHPR